MKTAILIFKVIGEFFLVMFKVTLIIFRFFFEVTMGKCKTKTVQINKELRAKFFDDGNIELL